MDVVLLSRLQFAFTIMFHYLFPPLTIGLSVVLVYLERVFKLHDFMKTVTTPPFDFARQGRRSRNDGRTVSKRFDRWTMADFASPFAQAAPSKVR